MQHSKVGRPIVWAISALALLIMGCGEEPAGSDSTGAAHPPKTPPKEARPAEEAAPPEVTERLPQTVPPAEEPVDEVVENAPATPEEKLAAEVAALKEMADDGGAQAQFALADRLAHGNGLEKNLEEAARYMRMAAEQGRADAQYSMGMKYETGMGVPKDQAEAQRWYRMAIESEKKK